MSESKDVMNVARFFKIIRVKLDLSQSQLADILDVDQSYVAQLEMGKYKKLPMVLIKKLYQELPTAQQKKELMDALMHEFYDFFTD
jgi:predicted transcriptional regulator